MKKEKGVMYQTRIIDPTQLEAQRLEAKAESESSDVRTITGYLAVFGNIDQDGERIIKGAFKKTIKDKFGPGKSGVPLMVKHWAHGGDTKEVIGTIVEAKEDDRGLWVKAEFSAVQLAQDTWTKINEGHVKGLSVGYKVIRHEFSPDAKSQEIVCNLQELALYEGTVTVRAVNEEAGIVGAKAKDEKIKELKDQLERLEGKTAKADATGPDDKGHPADITGCDHDIQELEIFAMRAKTALARERIICHENGTGKTASENGGLYVGAR